VTALVLLPGMDGSGAMFAGFIAALGDGITPLVLSYPADQILSYEGLADFARSRLPAGQPYVLLGESFSGPVAIALAAERPVGLVGLILSCTFVRNPLPLLRHGARLIAFLPVSSRLSPLAVPFLLGRHATPALRTTLRVALDRLAPAVLRARMRAVLAVDYRVRLGAIGVPVLYLQAAQDRVVPGASARLISALLPSAKVTVVCGPHLLLQAAPAQTAALVRDFINQLGRWQVHADCAPIASSTVRSNWRTGPPAELD
jgi:pimeloyl-[acyl-carrier protein] methyl ester esterase